MFVDAAFSSSQGRLFLLLSDYFVLVSEQLGGAKLNSVDLNTFASSTFQFSVLLVDVDCAFYVDDFCLFL